ncbi:EFR1 family ferrodoxin [Fusobacterium ulcerans]|uniref:EFR1 family ferrodoxin n=1 Tax=Fusobacterium ulcerans TaxID=861 RepID=UPI002671C38A|nr:EFR1 family ferrodoxin [Fusobacterium ulcerans]
MKIKKVWAVYFSATGTTKKIVTKIASTMAEKMNAEFKIFDFTLLSARKDILSFEKDDCVVLGTPVYAGRVPNLLLKYLAAIQGNGALAVPIVLFGNRNYDDALIELRDILEKNNFHTVGAGAFVGEHSFSNILAKNRPDEKDILIAENLGEKVFEKLSDSAFYPDSPIEVTGIPYPYRGYYQPLTKENNPIDMRKIKPLTNNNCTDCKICVSACPLGSIEYDDVSKVTGICMKCGACIKKCPVHAKYYTDESFLFHKHDLEEKFIRRAEPEIFI